MAKAQGLMSSTASNYDMSKLYAGLIIATGAVILATYALGGVLIESGRQSIPFIATTALYGTMMFASSYVEEEQQFWYWACLAWLLILTSKRCPSQIACLTARHANNI